MMDLYFYDGWDISVLVSIEKKWTSQIVLCFNASISTRLDTCILSMHTTSLILSRAVF